MLARMSASALTRLVLFALCSVFFAALRWVWSNVFGGFVDDWITGLLGPAIGIEEKQVIGTLTSWVVPAGVAYLAMWAAYSYGAHRSKLAKVAVPGPTPIPVLGATKAAPVDIRIITNQDLAAQVNAFTKRLRSFEAAENGVTDVEEMRLKAVNAKVDLALGKRGSDAASKEATKGEIAALELKANDLGKARAHRRLSEFQAQFLQEATQLRAELSRRTGRPVSGPDDPATDLLDKGKFDLSALRTLVSYFHEMADRLPD